MLILNQFIFTNHMRERFKERFCDSEEKKLGRKELNIKIAQELRNAKENKAIFNNSRFMLSVMEKYKSNNFKFFCTDKVIFVVNPENDDNIVITCYDRRKNYVPHLAETPKRYKKPKRKFKKYIKRNY
jgi:hypothetical protein